MNVLRTQVTKLAIKTLNATKAVRAYKQGRRIHRYYRLFQDQKKPDGHIIQGLEVLDAREYFIKVAKENLKQRIESKIYGNIIGKLVKFSQRKQRVKNRQEAATAFKKEYDNFNWDYQSGDFAYHPNLAYEVGLQTYGNRFGIVVKIWREYQKLLKQQKIKLDQLFYRRLSWERRRYYKDVRHNLTLIRREYREFERVTNRLKKLKDKIKKYFEILDEAKFDKEMFDLFNRKQINHKDINRARQVATRYGKTKFNVNQLSDEVADFEEWIKTLTKAEQKRLNEDIFRGTGSQVSFTGTGWIRWAAWIPLTTHLNPAIVTHRDFLHNTTTDLALKGRHIINNYTRGLLHVWVKRPSLKNPSGKYTWWNITLATWRKISKERTTAAFEKYFYAKNKTNMQYLLPNSIYWRKIKKRPRRKKPLLLSNRSTLEGA